MTCPNVGVADFGYAGFVKIAVEIADGVICEASQCSVHKPDFRLEKQSFRGDGLVQDYSWSEICSLVDEERDEFFARLFAL